jgi:glutamate N-acetyltransferase/amino-acid N-acetyltransferase
MSEPFQPHLVSVTFVPSDGSSVLPVLVGGEPERVDEERASQILAAEEFGVNVDLGLGNESATFWTCDFSYASRCIMRDCTRTDEYLTGICEDQW